MVHKHFTMVKATKLVFLLKRCSYLTNFSPEAGKPTKVRDRLVELLVRWVFFEFAFAQDRSLLATQEYQLTWLERSSCAVCNRTLLRAQLQSCALSGISLEPEAVWLREWSRRGVFKLRNHCPKALSARLEVFNTLLSWFSSSSRQYWNILRALQRKKQSAQNSYN